MENSTGNSTTSITIEALLSVFTALNHADKIVPSLDSEEQNTAFDRIISAVESDDSDHFEKQSGNIQDWSLAFGELRLLSVQKQRRKKFNDLRQNLVGSKAGNPASDDDRQSFILSLR